MDIRRLIPQIAQQEGVDPGTLDRLVGAESSYRTDAVSPKGARGPAQLMPATAQELGVNINDPVDNLRGGARYLKKQQDRFGDPRLALAAYNAGPGAVAKAGGVPQNGETPAYVDKVMGANQGSDDIFGFTAPSKAPQKGGASDDIFAMKPTEVAATAPAPVPAAPQAAPGLAQQAASDAWSGVKAPFLKLGADIADSYRKSTARAKAPLPSPLTALTDTVSDLGDTVRNIGDVFGLAGAPIQAAVNPVAGALSRNGPAIYDAPRPTIRDGRLQMVPARKLGQPEAQQALSNDINTALSAAAPETRAPMQGPPRPLPAKPMSLDQLQAAKTAAYKAVDSAGVAYKPQAVDQMIDGIHQDLAALKFNPDLHDKTAAMMKTVEGLRGSQPMTLTELDQLRQVVQRDVVSGGSDGDKLMGRTIKNAIQNLIDTAGPGDIVAGDPVAGSAALATARDLNTRWRKVEDVTDRMDSADLRASSTYAGGNQQNATRQNLRPLIDPKSPQRMRNLTPDETAAMNKVVRGSPAQNAVRVAGKVLDPRGLLGAAVQSTLGLPSHGLSLLSAPVGMAATEAGKAMTASAVNDLLRLMASGGTRASMSAARGSALAALPSARALVGVPTTLAPLARIPSRQEPAKKPR